MKSKGKTAWLITWEGPEADYIGRCKVVAILPPQLGEKDVTSLLPFLFCAEYTYTLCEKLSYCIPKKRDSFFKEAYRDINPEFLYGVVPKIYLSARKVKDLRCEEGKRDCFESTLYWTELPKFILNPNFNLNDPFPENLSELTKQVIGEREAQYTYSACSFIEEEKQRIKKKIQVGKFVIKRCP